MFSFWFLREYHLEVDAWVYHGMFGSIFEVLATLTFTALALLLCWSVEIQGSTEGVNDEEGHWAKRGMLVFAFFAVLFWARFDEVVFVGLIQALIFYMPFLIYRKPWRKFEIRDIMIGMLLICCGITILINTPVHFGVGWKSPLIVGVVFGLLNLLAYWLVYSDRVKTKWLLAVLIPYITLLTVILSLGKTNKQTSIWICRALAAVVFSPYVLSIGFLSYSHPKPNEIGSGENALDQIIAIGNEIGDISDQAPPYPKNRPTLRPFPKTFAQMQSVVDAYSPMTKKCRTLSSMPAWLSVNYDWKNFDDFQERCEERSALAVLTTTMLAEGKLAFLENRIDDGLASFSECMDLNRQCGSGGLPMNTSEAMGRDQYMIEKFADLQSQLNPEQAKSFAKRLLEQCDAYESLDVLMERRIAWEDRVPKWHQRLVLKYLAYQGRHPRGHMPYFISIHKTQLKLLALQLFIAAHQKTDGELPDSLDQILIELPNSTNSDPFSADGASFIYRKSEDEYVLYSVGNNGSDDGGGKLDLTLDSIRSRYTWAD